MLRRTVRRLQWMGGTHTTAVLGGKLRPHDSQYIQMEKQVVKGVMDRDELTAPVEHWIWNDHHRQYRADLYNEIAKLPLRFALHPYDRIAAKMDESAVGYAAPLGPADPLDTIPFHIHRKNDGSFAHRLQSVDIANQNPRTSLYIKGIEGDLFRFEDELSKLLPTFRTFVRDDYIYVWDAGHDVIEVLEHWYIALGF